MKRNNYASVVNSIGLISLLLGVFLSFTAIKGNFDNFKMNKQSFEVEYEQSKAMIQQTIDYKNGIGTEDLTAEDLMYLQTLNDSTIASYSESLEGEYQVGLDGLKAQMWDDIADSTGKQISLLLLGIALIFVAKGLKSASGLPNEDDTV
jgi:hypothetical protein